MKPMNEYSTTDLKAMAFDCSREIRLLERKLKEICTELIRRNELVNDVEIVPPSEQDIPSGYCGNPTIIDEGV